MLNRIKQDLKEAMLAHDEVKVSTMRLLLSEVNNAAIANGGELSETEITTVVQKELKKRQEAVAAFKNAGRGEAAAKEEAEAKILEEYLPTQVSDEELTVLIKQVINETAASSMQDMGKVIGEVISRVGQGAQGSRVSSLVREQLSS